MAGTKKWKAQIAITEEGPTVRAEAKLEGKGSQTLVGKGEAHCNPGDENDPAIGDELATARALSDLTHQLLDSAAKDIESHTHHPVQNLHL